MRISPLIFINYVSQEEGLAKEIARALGERGYRTWLIEENLSPGTRFDKAIVAAVSESYAAVVIVSRESLTEAPTSPYNTAIKLLEAESSQPKRSYLIIPVHVGSLARGQLPFSQVYPAEVSVISTPMGSAYESDRALQKILKTLEEALGPRGRVEAPAPVRPRADLVLEKVEVEDIRCFHGLELRLADEGGPIPWTLIVGDNAVGKSTLLRCVALGLCRESDAVTLMKTLPGALIRRGADQGTIRLTLTSREAPGEYLITTVITRESDNGGEVVRKQATHPGEGPFPWEDLFLCGYGTQRTAFGTASHEGYSMRAAVASLFDPLEELQNPELVLLRRPPEVRRRLEAVVRQVLMLDEGGELRSTKSGLEVDGPWGAMPLNALSDGYRTTTQWLLDFLGWLLFAERFVDAEHLGGVLLIDELEQHLHPRWQRRIVQELHRQLPGTQVLGSTHTPLVAAGLADLDRAQLVRLSREGDQLSAETLALEQLRGLRADQILALAFDLPTSKSPGSVQDIERYTELLSKGERSAAEDEEVARLRPQLERSLQPGSSPLEQKAAEAVSRALDELIEQEPRELLDLETRRQLKGLFAREDDE